jgi:hypothetical protein
MSKNSARSNYTNLMEWLNHIQVKRSKTSNTRKPSEWYEAEIAKQPKF